MPVQQCRKDHYQEIKGHLQMYNKGAYTGYTPHKFFIMYNDSTIIKLTVQQ